MRDFFSTKVILKQMFFTRKTGKQIFTVSIFCLVAAGFTGLSGCGAAEVVAVTGSEAGPLRGGTALFSGRRSTPILHEPVRVAVGAVEYRPALG